MTDTAAELQRWRAARSGFERWELTHPRDETPQERGRWLDDLLQIIDRLDPRPPREPVEIAREHAETRARLAKLDLR